ncbi:chemotaxis-specific protein-glutamate methyltransferase CheB [Pullulanibacillus sp. KACC 23026]|uniref:chemotaxis-specific protein-glutamate methyltransferase CheB n=1 Tax=Pullulanibacillus sp. KACC 23026 TaxID=3028315 RepID=UPI0023B18ED4|nr:chemotaxis-specific protein-glutamate methyltransferase CheB [Pullulanibacillus sp. KACC 23026]WEG11268.1 chemotaxis-specific protein-glutamate methyltransferase CheB [Pullulanibacillus sp. KACC 23026]
MKKFRILVVDDSAFIRRAIRHLLQTDPQFQVVGIARNGMEAIEKVETLKPDLVTLDVEMPVLNGFEALKKIMEGTTAPLVVLLSSRNEAEAREMLDALELGAIDFFQKENLFTQSGEASQGKDFLMRLKGILEKTKRSPKEIKKPIQEISHSVSVRHNHHMDLIFIGCSTGGPSALQKILPLFPKDFSIPIVVAQHMPPGFTQPLAERLDMKCPLKVKEAEAGERVQAGTIYIAPSGYQTTFIRNESGDIFFEVTEKGHEKTLYRPSVDVSLSSAAPIYKEKLLAVILTGMGTDGELGAGLVKKCQGTVFVEAEESCIVYGMPKAVLKAGHADGQFELSAMYDEIVSTI